MVDFNLTAQHSVHCMRNIKASDGSLRWDVATRNIQLVEDACKKSGSLLRIKATPSQEGRKACWQECVLAVPIGDTMPLERQLMPHFLWRATGNAIEHHLFFRPNFQSFLHVFELRDDAKGILMTYDEGFDLAWEVAKNPERIKTNYTVLKAAAPK